MPKPIVFTEARDPDEQFDPEVVASFDPASIPGYSEYIKANDIAAADDFLFREQHREALRPDGSQGLTKEDVYSQLGNGPRKLEFALSWQRGSGPSGADSHLARIQYNDAIKEGWRIIKADELRSLGCDVPVTATIEADGTIRRLDTVLCMRSGKLDRRWAEYRQKQAIEAEGTALPDTFRTDDGSRTYTAPTFADKPERTTLTVTGK